MFPDSIPYEGVSKLSLEDRCIRRPEIKKNPLDDQYTRTQCVYYGVTMSSDQINLHKPSAPIVLKTPRYQLEYLPQMLCVFCRDNREYYQQITSHNFTDDQGKVTCPVLRTHICPRCKKTGDEAHTLKFCPMTDKSGKQPRKMCVHCLEESQLPYIFNSHNLKDSWGKITCPKLRMEGCPRCGKTGRRTHILQDCPKNRKPEVRSDNPWMDKLLKDVELRSLKKQRDYEENIRRTAQRFYRLFYDENDNSLSDLW